MEVHVTVQPSGVVLVRPHGRLLPQGPEDGRVRPHEVDVHACVQLAVCGSARERERSRGGREHAAHTVGLKPNQSDRDTYRKDRDHERDDGGEAESRRPSSAGVRGHV